MRRLQRENSGLQRLQDEDRLVVSEPFADLPRVWNEIPGASVLAVQAGADELLAFRPHVEVAGGNGAQALGAARA